ncbi:hypothetical protein [Chamaesiphon sp. GL140_3_metabinner_50]|uniref:hypothetical protein n=1 Tax=Chamaesiphon sp. GL140_3_metabinner_50 TaxID=2970812 RepID=UPI0025D529A9|nr:hypothetical protein [Chamaesiphon sp. GL140_3_metabinner_50]
MKNSLELAISLIFLTGAMVVSGSILRQDVALAGESGAVGSISAQFSATGNNLVATSGAVAVGKSGGVTLARTNPNDLSTVAVGNSSSNNNGFIFGSLPAGLPPASLVVVLGFNDQNTTIGVLGEGTVERGTPSGNTFTAAPTLNLLPGTTTGVTIP